MKSRDRKALWISAAVIALFSLTGAALVVNLGGVGMIEVMVDESGSGGANLEIEVPAAFLILGLNFLPSEVYEEIDSETIPYLTIARRACGELRDIPDCVLVDVRDGRETVRISKEGDRLIINVRDTGEKVRVAIPLRAVDKVLGKMERRWMVL
ncbi:MAG: hypothetical protein JW958_01855 [Candidatus Eisenbacteria bacterium]|nr:hypothetical protein [Candidatus Eisenbacteria bacterium]